MSLSPTRIAARFRARLPPVRYPNVAAAQNPVKSVTNRRKMAENKAFRFNLAVKKRLHPVKSRLKAVKSGQKAVRRRGTRRRYGSLSECLLSER
jgi:hypothetical protein